MNKTFYFHGMKKILLGFMLMICLEAKAQQKIDYLFIGTYTNAGSYGVYVASFNRTNGKLTLIDSAQASNPSFL
ncbi:MAG: beta-propeller fold lactonase family protein, partial [Ferruginibacter sp.]